MRSDFIIDVLYSGFRELGLDIYDYPFKPHHHARLVGGKLQIQDNIGNTIGSEGDSDGLIHFVDAYGGLRKIPKWVCSLHSQGSQSLELLPPLDFSDFDLIIVGVIGSDKRVWDAVCDACSKARERTVFVDGSDDPFMRSLGKKVQLCFKRELMTRVTWRTFAWLRHIYPPLDLNLNNPLNIIDLRETVRNIWYPSNSTLKNILPINITVNSHSTNLYNRGIEKDYDISFLCSLTSKYRLQFAHFLRNFARETDLKIFIGNNENGLGASSFTGSLPWDQYSEALISSKISVSLPGLGYDTARYWEIPYYGAVLASPYLPIAIPNNFEDMNSAVFFKNYPDFASKVKKILQDGSWSSIAASGNSLFKRHHTSKKRAEYVLRSMLSRNSR